VPVPAAYRLRIANGKRLPTRLLRRKPRRDLQAESKSTNPYLKLLL
jgi:hypothetical protein